MGCCLQAVWHSWWTCNSYGQHRASHPHNGWMPYKAKFLVWLNSWYHPSVRLLEQKASSRKFLGSEQWRIPAYKAAFVSVGLSRIEQQVLANCSSWNDSNPSYSFPLVCTLSSCMRIAPAHLQDEDRSQAPPSWKSSDTF